MKEKTSLTKKEMILEENPKEEGEGKACIMDWTYI